MAMFLVIGKADPTFFRYTRENSNFLTVKRGYANKNSQPSTVFPNCVCDVYNELSNVKIF